MQKFVNSTIYILALLIPLFFLPLAQNPTTTPKLTLFVVLLITVIVSIGIRLFTTHKIKFPADTLPIVLFALSIVVSLFFNPESRAEALVTKAPIYIGGALLAILVSALSETSRRKLLYTLILSSTLLAIYSIAQLTFIHSLASVPSYMASRAFSPVGSPLLALAIFLITTPPTLYLAYKSRSALFRLLFGLAGTIMIIASSAYISLMLKGQELELAVLPFRASWFLSLELLKNFKNSLFGIGLNNFPVLFTTAKPLFLNSTKLWNFIPAGAGSELLQIFITAGLLALITLLMVIVRTLKNLTLYEVEYRIFLVGNLLAFLFLPFSLVNAIFFFLALGLASPAKPSSTQTFSPLAARSIASIAIAISGFILYHQGKFALSEYYMFQASQAQAKADSQKIYDNHLSAIKFSPEISAYHLTYSRLNLTLAASLSQKTDLTEQDRTNITTLISQSVREAKYVTSLRPNYALGWQNLGNIYRELINVAQGADQYAINNYAQAVALDPANPALRIDFGGLFYQLAASQGEDKKTERQALLTRAVQEFQTAIQLKPDYANAYYNLSKALESAGNIEGSFQAMQSAVTYLDPTSLDYATAVSELETLRTKLPKAPDTTQTPDIDESPAGDLTDPSPLPSPLPGGPIILPEESIDPTPPATSNP